MYLFRKITITAGLVACMGLCAGSQDKPGVTTMAASKFAPLPGLPACMTLSAQRGDPSKGPAVILAKFTSGCSVPWHWHTAAENLTVVSGKGKLEMKGSAVASPVAAGDYVYLPGKHEHQFTCISACTMFDSTEGAFDIHYVDKDGKEIPAEQALAAKKPAAKPAAKK